MVSQALFGILLFVSIVIAYLFLWRRTSGVQKPHRLYLKKQKTSRNIPSYVGPEVHDFSQATAREKNLNVIFIFNGHTFDAHEVLGIPAGANRKMIEEAYKLAKTKMNPDSQEFIQAAYQALIANL